MKKTSAPDTAADRLQRLQAENEALRQENNRLKDEMLRLISRNLDLSDKLEENMELRRRVDVARELIEGNMEWQRNADMKDDGQLMAIIEMRVEHERLHLQPDFDGKQLARVVGVSYERLLRLFRRQTIHRTPDAYIDNLRTITALRMLRNHPNYNIASIAEESGFNNVRTFQRRIYDISGMTPSELRALLTRDL